jgi:hypothetical protein
MEVPMRAKAWVALAVRVRVRVAQHARQLEQRIDGRL